MKYIVELFNNYGYITLITALILELLAFPLPGETIMTYCGYIIYEGKMNFVMSILAATLGVSLGITLSYFIGKILEMTFFEKYVLYIHINKKRLDKISVWFDKYGGKVLIVTYFIPGIRHVVGYFCGITKMSYKKFAINAYTGALIWTTTFISLGRLLGVGWEEKNIILKKYLFIGSLMILASIILICIYRVCKQILFKSAIFK